MQSFLISFNVIASTGSKHRMKRIFIMEILCIYAKRGFLPEFSKCIVISSSVARMRGRSERLERKRERGKRERRGKHPTSEKPIQN